MTGAPQFWQKEAFSERTCAFSSGDEAAGGSGAGASGGLSTGGAGGGVKVAGAGCGAA